MSGLGPLVLWLLLFKEDVLKFSIVIYRENKPHPLAALFLTNHDSLNNLGRGLPKKYFCQVILKSAQWFLTRRFLKFPVYMYREDKPRPLAAMFFDES